MSERNNWLMQWIKSLDQGGGPPKIARKKMFWLAGAIFVGVSLIVLGSSGDQNSPPSNENKSEVGAVTVQEITKKTIMAAEEEVMASKLKAMLEKIDGSGSVSVTIRLETSSRETYAINTTTGRKTTVEQDQGGGTRTINENNDVSQMVMARDSKGDSPVVEVENASEVAGVLIVASGAKIPRVKEQLFEAVRVALNVEPHRIVVLIGR